MGFWSKLGKIGLMAAPFVAAPFTGGLSLAAIGAGSGAVGGALNGGGLKGALLGGGLGAIPGLGSAGKLGKVGSALGMGGSPTGYIDDAIKGVAGSGGGAGSRVGSSLLGGLGKVFGKGGIDPTTALLGGMSLLGGEDGPSAFKGKVDPQVLLEQAMSSIQKGRPAHTRMKLPSPVAFNEGGMPTQIGGGLGVDPALRAAATDPMATPQKSVQRRQPRPQSSGEEA